ncbi:peptidylprolyl isomerase [Shewanella benthica]|uniref:peptidylprolyl isomerase n=1 Tax=Shewanella benthica TaxID=43661 RepID=UPI0018793AFC|nr:peptidylprolyl isomerase [Shewanella benthica]MBE7214702.1 peptidylprolyl isomerase [Shewanella benthica]MCL1064600.1 peptidylprolyl isomerase [Shewanella benthica]
MNKFAVSLASSLVLAAVLTACGGGSDDSGSTPPPITPPTPAPELAQDYCYTLSTSMGDITLAIDATNTPITGENFKQYVDTGFYDGLIFHRVIHQFMVQGGGFTPDLVKKETLDPIVNEASVGISNLRGTIAMARTSAPNSATSQFFINSVDNEFLDKANASDGVGYAVFGQVIDGIEIIDQIDIVDTNNDIPVEDIVINSIAEMTCPAT